MRGRKRRKQSFRSKFAAGDEWAHGAGHPSLSLGWRAALTQVMGEKMMEMEKEEGRRGEEEEERRRKVDATRETSYRYPECEIKLPVRCRRSLRGCSHIEANDGTQDRVGCADRFGLSAFLVLTAWR